MNYLWKNLILFLSTLDLLKPNLFNYFDKIRITLRMKLSNLSIPKFLSKI
jgi:hypothetical protein